MNYVLAKTKPVRSCGICKRFYEVPEELSHPWSHFRINMKSFPVWGQEFPSNWYIITKHESVPKPG